VASRQKGKTLEKKGKKKHTKEVRFDLGDSEDDERFQRAVMRHIKLVLENRIKVTAKTGEVF